MHYQHNRWSFGHAGFLAENKIKQKYVARLSKPYMEYNLEYRNRNLYVLHLEIKMDSAESSSTKGTN